MFPLNRPPAAAGGPAPDGHGEGARAIGARRGTLRVHLLLRVRVRGRGGRGGQRRQQQRGRDEQQRPLPGHHPQLHQGEPPEDRLQDPRAQDPDPYQTYKTSDYKVPLRGATVAREAAETASVEAVVRRPLPPPQQDPPGAARSATPAPAQAPRAPAAAAPAALVPGGAGGPRGHDEAAGAARAQGHAARAAAEAATADRRAEEPDPVGHPQQGRIH